MFDKLFDLFRQLDGGEVIGLVAVVLGISGGLVISICRMWFSHRKEELQIELKQEMLARGMSADEIVQVLNAGDPKMKVLERLGNKGVER